MNNERPFLASARSDAVNNRVSADGVFLFATLHGLACDKGLSVDVVHFHLNTFGSIVSKMTGIFTSRHISKNSKGRMTLQWDVLR